MKKYIFIIICALNITLLTVNAQTRYNKLLYKGVSLERGKSDEEALKLYSEAIELKPSKTDAFIYRSKLNFRLKNYDNAMLDINKALSINPQNEEALYIRAKLNVRNANYIDAVEDYKSILTLSKENSVRYRNSLFNLSECYLLIGNVKEQNMALDKLINNYKANALDVPVDYYQKRGVSYLKLSKYKEAVSDLEFIEKKYPNDANNLYRIAWAFHHLKDDANSLIYFDKITNVDPSKKIVYNKNNYKQFFEYDKNKSNFLEGVLDISTKLSMIKDVQSENFAQIEYKSLFESGMDIWYRLIALYPEDEKIKTDYLQVLKSIYTELNDKPIIPEEARKLVVQATNATEEKRYPEAIFLFMKSLKVAPCNHLAYYNLALLYERIGSNGAAISQMQEYIKLYPQAADIRSAQDKIYTWEGKLSSSNPISTFTDPELKNEYTLSKADDGFFIISYGFNNALGPAKLFDQYESIESRFFTTQQLGLKNGFCIEIGGGGGDFSNMPKNKFGVGMEILFRYRQNKLDWASAGGMFAESQNLNKSLRYFEFAEKINFSYRVAQNTFTSLYYSPALVVPFNTEFQQETLSTTYIYDISNPPRFGQSIGWSIRYKKFLLGYEWHFIGLKTTIYDKTYDVATKRYTYNNSTTGKYRITYGNFRLAFYL